MDTEWIENNNAGENEEPEIHAARGWQSVAEYLDAIDTIIGED